MSEDADVGVRVPALIEWIDKDRGPGGPAAADEKSVGLLQVGFPPGKEGGESSRVEHPFSLQPIGSSGPLARKPSSMRKVQGWRSHRIARPADSIRREPMSRSVAVGEVRVR